MRIMGLGLNEDTRCDRVNGVAGFQPSTMMVSQIRVLGVSPAWTMPAAVTGIRKLPTSDSPMALPSEDSLGLTVTWWVDIMAKCQVCRRRYRVDLSVPDALWNMIRPSGKAPGQGMLCGSCIMKRVDTLGRDALIAVEACSDEGRHYTKRYRAARRERRSYRFGMRVMHKHGRR